MSPGENWDAQKMFDLYVHDYMVRKKMFKAAEIFKKEAQVADNDVLLNDGFLSDFGSILFDKLASAEAKLDEDNENLNAQAAQMVPPQVVLGRSPVNNGGFDMMMANPTACLDAAMNFEKGRQYPREFNPNIRMHDICKMRPPNMVKPGSSHMQQMNSNERPPMIRRENKEGIVWRQNQLINPALSGEPYPNVPPRKNGAPSAGLIQGVNQIQLHVLPLDDQVLGSLPQVPQQRLFVPLDSLELGQSVQSFIGMSNDLIGSDWVATDNNVMDARMASRSEQVTEDPQKEGEVKLQLQEENNDIKEDGCVDSFLSQHDEDEGNDPTVPFSALHRRSFGSSSQNKEFTFNQIRRLHSSKNKVLCCHFSSEGTLLASAGHDKKVWICNVGNFDVTSSSEGHSQLISDIRFQPKSTFLATSSFDKSIQIWDAQRPSKSLFRLLGHNEQVTSLDFHPRKTNCLCSCDSDNEIRVWNMLQSTCTSVIKGANRQVRFQPNTGGLLAGAQGNVINLIDFETERVQLELKGHAKDVRSLCWDSSGKYIASVCEDSAKIWSVASGSCIHQLDGNNFQSCTFHPGYSLMLVIGGYQNLQLWNPTESNKTKTVEAHDGFVAALADSPQNEYIASASHDQWVKLWK